MAVKTVTVTVNGQTYTLTSQGDGTYTGTFTAPTKTSYDQPDNVYNCVVTASDTAGNSVTADKSDFTQLGLRVKATVAPIISITYPTASATITNNKPTITWTVTSTTSGVDSSTISIKIDSGAVITSGITKTTTTNGFTCSYTPTSALGDGNHTITINAKDNDGNAATAATSTFKVDTVPPTLTVNSPVDNYITNDATLTVSGTTNDTTSSPVTLKVNGTAVTVGSNGAWTTTVTLKNGANTITVVATDSAGKTSTVTRNVTLDTTPPEITAVTITPNPVDTGATVTITVTVTD